MIRNVLRISMVALLLFSILGLPFGPVSEVSAAGKGKSRRNSARSEKLAADLKDMSNRSPNNFVSVILQTPSGPLLNCWRILQPTAAKLNADIITSMRSRSGYRLVWRHCLRLELM